MENAAGDPEQASLLFIKGACRFIFAHVAEADLERYRSISSRGHSLKLLLSTAAAPHMRWLSGKRI